MEQTNWRCVRQKVGKALIRRSRQCVKYCFTFPISRQGHNSATIACECDKRRGTSHVSTWRTRAYEDVAAGRIDAALSAEEVPPALQSEIIRVDPR